MPVCSLSEWNQFIKEFPEVHFMQTGEWGLLKSSFGWDAVRVRNSTSGVQILIRKLPLGFSIAYIPKGPLGNDFTSIWSEVDKICRQYRAIFLKVEIDLWQDEPLDQQKDFPGFIPSHYNIQPPNTIIINLNETESDLLQKMRQKTRYNINLAVKKGVSIHPWDDINEFHRMINETGSRDGFGVHNQDYYQRVYDLFHPAGMCELLVAKYGNQSLAAVMVFSHGKRAWYVYGASTELERNRMPAYLLQWEAIRWAQARGCQSYDLWGIPDKEQDFLETNFMNRSDGLWGVYRFKRGFGGKGKRAVQALDKVYNPILFSVYSRYMATRVRE